MGETSRFGRAATGSPELAPGARIRHYELVREIGRGGMGVVYEARDIRLKRRVAIKLLHSTTRDIADRFLSEARATARCTHENIVVIHEVDEHDGIPYMVLELVEGRSLREIMGTQVEPTKVVDLMLAIGRALQRAHGLGIVHRDLKPENVLVTDAGQVKVLDFGIAKALGEGDPPLNLEKSDVKSFNLEKSAKNLQLTADGAMIGTLPYMAPEQMGTASVDHRTDLWALGIMAFELLAGHHPVQPLATDVLIENLLSTEPMASARDIAGVSPALAEIIDTCLAKKKPSRIGAASTLVRRLEALRTERLSQEVMPVTAIAVPTRRPRWWLAVLAGVVLAGGIATAAIVLSNRGAVEEVATPMPPRTTADPVRPAVEPPADAAAPAVEPSADAAVPAVVVSPPPKPNKPTRPTRPPGSGSAKPAAGSAKPCNIFTDRIGC